MKDNIWLKYDENDINRLNLLCDEYRKFISNSKIEREVINNSIEMAEDRGFVNSC